MNQVKSNKLQTKDLIIAGAFAALYVVLLFVVASLTHMIPILYICTPFILSVVVGPVYMLYATKIPKRWSLMILAALVGLVLSMGGRWFVLIWCLILGIIADYIANTGTPSLKKYRFSFMVFACTNMGPFWAVIIAKKAFLESLTGYYGPEYANSIDVLTPWWIILVFIALAVAGGFVGATLGSSLLKKHFVKAGVV